MRCGSKLMDSNQAAWFNPDDCIIYMPDTMGNQVLLHEFGHLLDHALAKDGYFYYTTSKDFHQVWKQGAPINWYAARNPREYFAEGVTAYLLQELDGRTDDGRQIDRTGLMKRDPKLYTLLEAVFSDPNLQIIYDR
ncbi:MAG: anthrax toxin lethal factor-related metalloendopeptidase [Armatimonadota bacterium]